MCWQLCPGFMSSRNVGLWRAWEIAAPVGSHHVQQLLPPAVKSLYPGTIHGDVGSVRAEPNCNTLSQASCSCLQVVAVACRCSRCCVLCGLCGRVQGGGQAQQAALVAALVKNVYNGDPANKPWAELMSRYLFRCASRDLTDGLPVTFCTPVACCGDGI